jgi:hypothetical protein
MNAMAHLRISPATIQNRTRLRREATRLLRRADRRRYQTKPRRPQMTTMTYAFSAAVLRYLQRADIDAPPIAVPSNGAELARTVFQIINNKEANQ